MVGERDQGWDPGPAPATVCADYVQAVPASTRRAAGSGRTEEHVLEFGDARFQRRCHEEFAKRRKHANLIMVSHAPQTLLDYCNRGVVLAHGKLHVFSNVEDAVELYKQLNA